MTVTAPADQSKDKKTGEYTTWPDIIKHWPKTTLLIVSNEFCERFSYYGMKSVLFIYLTNILMFTDYAATLSFSFFNIICFTTPILGSIIADGYLGKFWTIFFVSIVYTAGQITLAVSSFGPKGSWLHPWLDIIGMLVIALGTGGIKPCVSSFGADQFPSNQLRMLSLFFSAFYFSINAGAVISSWISPYFRSQTCMGLDACFPFAFGAPAVLMIVATVIFMAGSLWYKKNPPKENIFAEVYRVIKQAISNKMRADVGKDHWVDHYMNTHDCQSDKKCLSAKKELRNPSACHKRTLVDDIKYLFKVIIIILPVPMFWALFSQQGTVWMRQGIQLDTRIFFGWEFLPDQMTAVNGLLILVIIPIAQIIVYPLVEKCICEFTPLRKMVAGGLIAAISFVIAGLVQLQVNKALPLIPEQGVAYVGIWNQLDNCGFNATIANNIKYLNSSGVLMDNIYLGTETFRVPAGGSVAIQITFEERCSRASTTYTLNVSEKETYTVVISDNGIYNTIVDTQKPKSGKGEFSISLISTTTPEFSGSYALCRVRNNNADCSPSDLENYLGFSNPKFVEIAPLDGKPAKNASIYNYKQIKYGNFGVFYANGNNFTQIGNLNMDDQGGVYVLDVTGNKDKPSTLLLEAVPHNRVGILWQFPQYIVITAAEVLFSVTGYEFAYSQSAPTMKAMVQAIWLLTMAFGDVIIVIITIIDPFSNMATLYFAYAGAMAVVMVVFALMARFYYEYHYYTQETAISETDYRETETDDIESTVSDYRNNPFFNSDTEEATPEQPPARRIDLGETKF